MHVHGVAIPTIDGIQNVLNHIGAKQDLKQKGVLWHNLREEPVRLSNYSHKIINEYFFFIFVHDLYLFKQVVYINGRPFVLRDVERPFSNLEYTVCR